MSVRIWVSLAILAAALGCGARNTSQPEPVRWVRVAFPEVKQQPESYPLSGTVVPQGAAQTLSFLVPGRVVKVGPREGECIRKGQVLANLDPISYAAGLQAAAAQARSAQAAAARAHDEFQRMNIIHDRQSLADNDFLKFQLADQAAREQLVQAQANEQVVRKSLSDTSLRTLVGGVVTRRSVEPGVMVAAGQPAFEIAQLDPVEIQIGIPENLVGALKVGQRATVTLSALPTAKFEGKLRVINAAVDPGSRTYMARITVKNPEGVLHLGMIAEARIQGSRQERMVLVPYDAIVKDPQGAAMVFEFRPGEKRVVARRVTLGALEGKLVQVRSGVDPETQLVVAGQHYLRDGASAQVETTNAPTRTGAN
ncbi:MAG: efflux RND transporter periplasmic adaptor subunit [Holophaga sp.]|nr:efflux RND transporter periplasmic adaptor subunit [Holophaga sp.]